MRKPNENRELCEAHFVGSGTRNFNGGYKALIRSRMEYEHFYFINLRRNKHRTRDIKI
jgi:hypothetical protein